MELLDFHYYFFWLLVISAFCFFLERLRPWRKQQRAFRPQFWQDVFWLVLNGHFVGLAVGIAAGWIITHISAGFDRPHLTTAAFPVLLAASPLWLQFIVVLVGKDFVEYGVHNLLHRVPWLWEFHKLHHSILELDWIGNMRFHWMEIVVYRGFTFLPLALLGAQNQVLLWVAIVTTLIGHLNHSNLNIGWGPFRYVLNSPRFHVWHHDLIMHGQNGRNFAIVFSIWDWLFGTAEVPPGEQPRALGFASMEAFPHGLVARLIYPARAPILK